VLVVVELSNYTYHIDPFGFWIELKDEDYGMVGHVTTKTCVITLSRALQLFYQTPVEEILEVKQCVTVTRVNRLVYGTATQWINCRKLCTGTGIGHSVVMILRRVQQELRC
jgi:hypothetical protein